MKSHRAADQVTIVDLDTQRIAAHDNGMTARRVKAPTTQTGRRNLSLTCAFAFSALIFVGVALFATSASAATSRYLLRHPSHEHCKHGYVRSTKIARSHGKRKRQVWCSHHAPAREVPPGSLEWLLAHTSVAHVSEVFASETAAFYSGVRSQAEARHAGDNPKWVASGVTCETGYISEQAGLFGTRSWAYIWCGETAELQYVAEVRKFRRGPCTPEETKTGEPETCYPSDGGYKEEEFMEPQPASEKWKAGLQVDRESESANVLCGDLSTYVLVGNQWESTQVSRPVCNVSI